MTGATTRPPNKPAGDLRSGMKIPVRDAKGGRWPARIITTYEARDGYIHIDVARYSDARQLTVRVPAGRLVSVLTEHYGVCNTCGQLSPCTDEQIDAALDQIDQARLDAHNENGGPR